MKALILEDELLAAEKLKKLIGEVASDIEIVDTIRSVEGANDWLDNNKEPDVIFSDIQLLDGLCFKIFENRKVSCPIIFTTAYDQYAIKAFETNSVDYLLKPVIKDKLEISIQKLREKNSSNTELPVDRIMSWFDKQSREYKKRFLVKIGNKIRAVSIDKIAYFYSEDKITFIRTFSNERYPIDNTLDELEQTLDPIDFFRANRKFLIHINSIEIIHPYFKGRVLLELTPAAEEKIVVSSEKTPIFKSWLDE